jgi:cell wall-associated NlpC family hydrolase
MTGPGRASPARRPAARKSDPPLDPRLHAFRVDLADERLSGVIAAPRYVAGREMQITAGLVAVRRAPSPDAPIDTYFRGGESVLVFDDSGAFLWCQSRFDGYVGYVPATAVAPAAAPTHHIATLGSYTYREPDLRSEAADFLPRHAAATVAAAGLVTRGTEYARLAQGSYIPLACLATAPPRSPDIVAAAALYLGCPYLWAGATMLGIDCSGLVQNAFRDIGVRVLRDTDMQRETIGAKIAASSERGLRRGDLLYLPGHVLIYAGDGMAIHADGASMMVRRERLADFLTGRNLSVGKLSVRRYRGPEN